MTKILLRQGEQGRLETKFRFCNQLRIKNLLKSPTRIPRCKKHQKS